MQVTTGWLFLPPCDLLYFAGAISSFNFQLAQPGIQEYPEASDSVLQTVERFAAYQDSLTSGWLPLSGIWMISDHDWWRIAALKGGSTRLDASGRQDAKMISFRKDGFRLGTKSQQHVFFAGYIVMAFIGMSLIVNSISNLTIYQCIQVAVTSTWLYTRHIIVSCQYAMPQHHSNKARQS
jgi:hypothetical protein